MNEKTNKKKKMQSVKTLGKIAKITGSLWPKVARRNVLNENVLIKGFDFDIQAEIPSRSPIFRNAKNVFMLECDKNAVYYLVGTLTFPRMQNLYLASHPCESKVFRSTNANIFVWDHYKYYAKNWGGKRYNDTIKCIGLAEIENLIEQYEEEELIVEDRK